MPQSSHKRTPVRYRDQVHYVSDDVAVVGTTSFIKWNEREVKRQYAKLRGAKFGTPREEPIDAPVAPRPTALPRIRPAAEPKD